MIAPEAVLNKANSNPINKISKRFLEKAGASPDPTSLYSTQLMKWGIEIAGIRLYAKFHDQIVDVLENFSGMNPEKVMYFLEFEDGEALLSPEELEEEETPEDAAWHLIESLHQKMSSSLVGYQLSSPAEY